MKIRSREMVLALAALGLLSYAACTTGNAETKDHQAQASPTTPQITEMPNVQQAPKLVDGIFASDDHLQPVFFDLNKSKLSDKSIDIVKANAEWLKTQPPYLIRLVGFSDSRGSIKKNERLAERRANTLRDTYASLGISPERLSVITRGAETPACQPVTEDCLAKSRRTETLMEEKSLASR